MEAEIKLLLSLKISWSEAKRLENGEEISTYYNSKERGRVKVSVIVKPEDFTKDTHSESEVCDTTFLERENELLIRIPLSELKNPITRRFSGEIEGGVLAKSFKIDID